MLGSLRKADILAWLIAGLSLAASLSTGLIIIRQRAKSTQSTIQARSRAHKIRKMN
jgi:hypothetical protein